MGSHADEGAGPACCEPLCCRDCRAAGWLQAIGRATPFRYIIDAMREGYAGHYLNAVMLEGVAVSIGLAVVCLWLAGRVFIRENA